MNPLDQASINSLHALFVRLTGREEVLTLSKIFIWECWMIHGWNADDLTIAVEHIKKGIKAKRRNDGALKFHNLIANVENFSGDLSEARALARRPVVDKTRSEALRSTGRPATEMPHDTAVHVSQVLSKATMDNWEAMKRQLGITPNGQ